MMASTTLHPPHRKINDEKFSFLDLPKELRDVVYKEYSKAGTITIHLLINPHYDPNSDAPADWDLRDYIDTPITEGSTYPWAMELCRASALQHGRVKEQERKDLISRKEQSGLPLALLEVSRITHQEAKDYVFSSNKICVMADDGHNSENYGSLLDIIPRRVLSRFQHMEWYGRLQSFEGYKVGFDSTMFGSLVLYATSLRVLELGPWECENYTIRIGGVDETNDSFNEPNDPDLSRN